MLFHSEAFLFVFLPATLAAYYLLARHTGPRLWCLLAASILFYGYWDARLVPLLVGSFLANWLLARAFSRLRAGVLIGAGVSLNLGLLAIFKYADFLAGTAAFVGGWQHQRWNIVLPLAISFFTFQQISYLVDLKRGRATAYSFRDYALYVSFFPQLIAGPIVRHHEIIPQFTADPLRPGLSERIGRGLAMFAIGLAKKVILADELAVIADRVFAKVSAGEWVFYNEGWTGLLAFTFQIYFDFSGYSDMAIGLALMFGLTLPLNFDSPLKATAIRELWRRWHMTLIRFMRDYLYRPIGLSLSSRFREPIATMITMTLVGLWHGASWTFVVFGAAHGLAMVVSQAWISRRPDWLAMPPLLGWFLTFGFFMLSASFFRSPDLPAALRYLELTFAGGVFSLSWTSAEEMILLGACAIVAFLCQNSQTLVLQRDRPGRLWPLACAAVLVYVVLNARNAVAPTFIYFQF